MAKKIDIEDNVNLTLYDKVKEVPENALKTIKGGRLNGMKDINPMWRIRELTSNFGPCGVGWYYEIIDKKLESSGTGEIACFLTINLYTKNGEEWSKPIVGVGGNMFVTQESKGLHVSDECFKMALTDAISVACKALGFGADIYWDSSDSKYANGNDSKQKPSFPNKNTDLYKQLVITKNLQELEMSYIMTAQDRTNYAASRAEYTFKKEDIPKTLEWAKKKMEEGNDVDVIIGMLKLGKYIPLNYEEELRKQLKS